jgi:hypothetical protein
MLQPFVELLCTVVWRNELLELRKAIRLVNGIERNNKALTTPNMSIVGEHKANMLDSHRGANMQSFSRGHRGR